MRVFRAVLAGAALGRRNGNVCTFSSVVSTRTLTSKNGVEYAGNVKMINNMNVWRTTRYAGIVQEFRLKKSMIMGTGTERCFSTEVSTAIPAFPPGPLATSEALKSPTAAISYDDSNHDRFPPGDPSRRAFTYFVLTGSRFIYASAIRLAVLKFVLSMSASKDVLAMAQLEVELGNIAEGNTVTVKWRGKPVFIRHRSEAEVELANSVDVASLRDPQEDEIRVVEPKWLVVIGVCTHLGCVPLANAGDYNGWFCPCHGSHYDVSGRIRKGPAPYNLEVPVYKFLEEDKMIIG